MYGFCRLGTRPLPSRGAACRSNGLETKTSRNAKQVAVERQRERAEAGEDEQPEQQRPLLTAPEGAHGIGEGQLARGVLGYVGEGEVARVQCVEQDERGDGGGGEGAD